MSLDVGQSRCSFLYFVEFFSVVVRATPDRTVYVPSLISPLFSLLLWLLAMLVMVVILMLELKYWWKRTYLPRFTYREKNKRHNNEWTCAFRGAIQKTSPPSNQRDWKRTTEWVRKKGHEKREEKKQSLPTWIQSTIYCTRIRYNYVNATRVNDKRGAQNNCADSACCFSNDNIWAAFVAALLTTLPILI